MPIDPEKAVAAPALESERSWNEQDVILYHLGVGAGSYPGSATDAKELRYVYEAGLQVLPTFSVVPTMGDILRINEVPGVEIDFAKILHGEQETILHRPLPPSAQVMNRTRVADVQDKDSAALITLEIETSDATSGELVATNRFIVFARGEGGFGIDPPTTARERPTPPDRGPDLTVSTPTLEHQALLYRLSGDTNPLHADPNVAHQAGFDRPILHGLCTYGLVCKQVVDAVLDGDVSRVSAFRARFSDVVFPGDTIETSAWVDGSEVIIESRVPERNAAVLTAAKLTVAGSPPSHGRARRRVASGGRAQPWRPGARDYRLGMSPWR